MIDSSHYFKWWVRSDKWCQISYEIDGEMLRIYDRPFGFRFLTKSTAKHFMFAYAPADTLMVCDAISRSVLASLCQKFSSWRLRIYVALRDHGGGGIFEENDGGVDKEVSLLWSASLSSDLQSKSTAKCYAFASACFTSDACLWHINGLRRN